ncbi:MAG: haloacid dehalogenase-like hydrolase [Candidatus Nealsonbacteria bacterium]|nr:haloacid dehalogenase-like hydrolase [Candidatus Nealsonbacteria bacterium]
MPDKFESSAEQNMENVSVADKEKFAEIEKKFQEDGLDKVHILADFDKTLTRAFIDGVEVQSIISVLRDNNYLTSDYAGKAHKLYSKYNPFESDPNVSKNERKKLMAEWWAAHFKLLIESGLNIKDIEKAVKSGRVRFRDGFLEFVDFLKDNSIPLVIMSSSGLGQEAVSKRLEQEGKLYPNIHIISNSFEWDENGKAVSVKQPIVHGANKDETLVSSFPDVFKAVKDRKNVILLGDGLDDVGMVEGFDYDNLIKIGFFNDKTKERKEAYKDAYDVLVENDSSLDFVNNFLKKISKK